MGPMVFCKIDQRLRQDAYALENSGLIFLGK